MTERMRWEGDADRMALTEAVRETLLPHEDYDVTQTRESGRVWHTVMIEVDGRNGQLFRRDTEAEAYMAMCRWLDRPIQNYVFSDDSVSRVEDRYKLLNNAIREVQE